MVNVLLIAINLTYTAEMIEIEEDESQAELLAEFEKRKRVSMCVCSNFIFYM